MWLPIPMETTRFTAIPTRPTPYGSALSCSTSLRGWDKYDKAMEAYKYIDEIVAEGKENCLAAAKEWADKEKRRACILCTGFHSNYGVAYSMCCCHFMEMQWKHAVCLHTGEYFHGPFETTDKKLPMILIMSEGRTRALDERCLKFLNTYAENFIVIDFKELNKGPYRCRRGRVLQPGGTDPHRAVLCGTDGRGKRPFHGSQKIYVEG